MKKSLMIGAALLAAMAAVVSVPDAGARKIRTSHKIQRESGKSEVAVNDIFRNDSLRVITPDSACWDVIKDKVRFYGFDKTANSNTESFFISNGTDSTLVAVGFDIVYTDMKKRQLHRRHIELKCDVAPGETMRHDIKSWDTQKSFYFHQSAKPRRQATPFDVRIILQAAAF